MSPKRPTLIGRHKARGHEMSLSVRVLHFEMVRNEQASRKVVVHYVHRLLNDKSKPRGPERLARQFTSLSPHASIISKCLILIGYRKPHPYIDDIHNHNAISANIEKFLCFMF